MSAAGCIRCQDDASDVVALDDRLMHSKQRSKASARTGAASACFRADPFSTVGTLLSTSLDAGVPLRDVQEAASHADPRTTMRYDRAPGRPGPARHLYRRRVRRGRCQVTAVPAGTSFAWRWQPQAGLPVAADANHHSAVRHRDHRTNASHRYGRQPRFAGRPLSSRRTD